jgi:hypothetical protein
MARPQAPAQPAATIRVDGQLLVDAQLRFSAAGLATLHYCIAQPGGRPLHAVEEVGGEPPRVQAARARLALLRSGHRVSVFAQGVRAAQVNGDRVLQLVEVRQVIPHAQHPSTAGASE